MFGSDLQAVRQKADQAVRRYGSHGDSKCWVRWGESRVRAECTLQAYKDSPAEVGSQSGDSAAWRITSALTFSGPTSENQTDCGPLRCTEEVIYLVKMWENIERLWHYVLNFVVSINSLIRCLCNPVWWVE